MIDENPFAYFGSRFKNSIDSNIRAKRTSGYTISEFFEKRIKIQELLPPKRIIPLRANSIQALHQRTKDRHKREGKKPHFLLLKYRRGGITTWEQATSYRSTVVIPNTSCATVADTKENTKTSFRMVARMAHLDDRKPIDFHESKTHIEVPNMHTYFSIGTAGTKAFSRGDDLHRFHGSEVAWWQGSEDDIENLAAGFTEAARYGEVVLETTANGAEGWFYERFKEAMDGDSTWVPLFYPWYIDPVNVLHGDEEDRIKFYDTVTDEEKEVMEKFELTFEQMLWRRDKKRERKKLFQQEYPETWEQAFVVRGSAFFDLEMLEKLSRKVNKPIDRKLGADIWEHPKKGEEYTVGADTAEGRESSDNCVCAILNKKTGKQAARLTGKWRPEVFARKCVDLCKYYNGAIFACEINNHGHSVMNTVINTLMYKHLYYRERPIDKDKYGGSKKEKVPGWLTNGKTRPILLDELNEAMEEGWMQVNDPVFIAECKTFVDTGGRYEADKNQHDDSILAWGIAWQARKQRKLSYIVT